MKNQKAVKNNLKMYRKSKRLTQGLMAIELDISLAHYRAIETDFKCPKYQVRSKICDFFKVKHYDMFSLYDDKEGE